MKAIYEPAGAAREYSPLACNLFRGCTHGCRYCYAPKCLYMSPQEFHAGSMVRAGILDALAKDAPKHAASGLPVLFCFTSDAYQDLGQEHKDVTREALRIMNAAGCRFQVLTKGGTRALPDLPLYRNGAGEFGTTLLFTDDHTRQDWEPNAATVEDRIEALRQFHAAGVRTWVSIEPVIVPEQAVALIEQLSPWVDEWRVGKLNHHPAAKTVDWHAFAAHAYAALAASGRDYMVKDALQRYLPPGAEVARYAKTPLGQDRQRLFSD